MEKQIKDILTHIQAEGEDKETKRVQVSENKLYEIVQKINLSNPDLATVLDDVIGEYSAALAEMYFELGYKNKSTKLNIKPNKKSNVNSGLNESEKYLLELLAEFDKEDSYQEV